MSNRIRINIYYQTFKNSSARFSFLLLFLTLQIFVPVLSQGSVLLLKIFYLNTYLVFISALVALQIGHKLFKTYIILAIVSLVCTLLYFKNGDMYNLFISELCDSITMMIVIYSILRIIRVKLDFTADTISATICVYLLLGMLWTNAYVLCMIDDIHSFTGVNLDESILVVRQNLGYFSYITMLTIGYGDIAPATPLARSLVVVQGIMGQMYIAVVVAGTVSVFLSKQLMQSREAEMEREVEFGIEKDQE